MRDEILDIANGNPRLADSIREILHSLTRHESDKVREMARDVLDGASLREMGSTSAYGEELGAAFATFWSSYQELPPESRGRLEEDARHRFGMPGAWDDGR